MRVNAGHTLIMNNKSFLSAILLSAGLLFAGAHAAQPATGDRAAPPAGTLTRVSEKNAAWAAKARESYPLQVCAVSNEALGSMGRPPEYVYALPGQPDRLVIFCCAGCEEDFMKEPAKHLAKIDAAAKAKAGEAAKKADAKR